MATLPQIVDSPQETKVVSLEDFPPFDSRRVKASAIERARSLIKQFDLHHYPDRPVDLAAIVDKFDVRFLDDLPATTWGFTLDIGPRIIVAVNQNLSEKTRRFVLMHETGHVALWHPNQLHACLVEGQEAYDQLESDATAFAAVMLIPRLAFVKEKVYGKATTEELAARFVVPPELVLIREAVYARYKY